VFRAIAFLLAIVLIVEICDFFDMSQAFAFLTDLEALAATGDRPSISIT
jgi:hypothetical protein